METVGVILLMVTMIVGVVYCLATVLDSESLDEVERRWAVRPDPIVVQARIEAEKEMLRLEFLLGEIELPYLPLEERIRAERELRDARTRIARREAGVERHHVKLFDPQGNLVGVKTWQSTSPVASSVEEAAAQVYAPGAPLL